MYSTEVLEVEEEIYMLVVTKGAEGRAVGLCQQFLNQIIAWGP